MNTIINLVISGVIGWVSGYLPFVKQIGTTQLTSTIANVVSGLVGGGIASSVLGSSTTTGSFNPVSILGSVVGAGAVSTIASQILGAVKK
jgi:uncharacterized membrane protein YeaQ/YmgE (transglycosylase-associated protein family)